MLLGDVPLGDVLLGDVPLARLYVGGVFIWCCVYGCVLRDEKIFCLHNKYMLYAFMLYHY